MLHFFTNSNMHLTTSSSYTKGNNAANIISENVYHMLDSFTVMSRVT